jgi:hypothetical protein
MRIGELDEEKSIAIHPSNIPHKDPTVPDRTDKERRKTQ